MPQAPEYKKQTTAEIKKASKRLPKNVNETFIHNGKRISAWVDDKTKPIITRSGRVGYQKKLHPAFKKKKQAAKLVTRPKPKIKDAPPKAAPKKRTGKTPRHGPGTYGAPSTKYGERKPVIGSVPPPRKPPAPSTTTPTLVTRPKPKIQDAPPRAAPRSALPPTAWGGISGGSDVDTTNVQNTRAMNAARAAKTPRHGPGTYGAVIPPRRGTPAPPPTKMSDAIEPEITAQRKKVLAERAAATAAKAPPKQRWPGAMQRRVSTKDQGVLETGRLEGEGVESTELQKHQQRQALRKLVEKFGGSIRDWWNKAKNRPMTEAEARARKAIAEGTRNREENIYSTIGIDHPLVERYRGGSLKKNKKKKKKKPISRRVKNKHSGYGKHDGNKAVSDSYD